jgi:hypothetical protein
MLPIDEGIQRGTPLWHGWMQKQFIVFVYNKRAYLFRWLKAIKIASLFALSVSTDSSCIKSIGKLASLIGDRFHKKMQSMNMTVKTNAYFYTTVSI